MDGIVERGRRAPLWRVLRPFGRWTRVTLEKREVVARALISLLPFVVGIVTLLAEATRDEPVRAGRFVWPAIWLFVAWRFFRMGLYTSPWGVRITNPVLTYWYPWRNVFGFTLVAGEESFLPKSQIVALVTKRERRRPIFALSSTVAFFRLSKAHQAEILEQLNRLATRTNEA